MLSDRLTSTQAAPSEPWLEGWWQLDGKTAELVVDAAAEGQIPADVTVSQKHGGYAIVELRARTLEDYKAAVDALRQCAEAAAGYPLSMEDFLDRLTSMLNSHE